MLVELCQQIKPGVRLGPAHNFCCRMSKGSLTSQITRQHEEEHNKTQQNLLVPSPNPNCYSGVCIVPNFFDLPVTILILDHLILSVYEEYKNCTYLRYAFVSAVQRYYI